MDGVVEDVAQTLLAHAELRDEDIVAAQRRLVLQVHASHHGVDALLVKAREAHAERREVEMARVLGVVEIVGIVHDALDVALVVANLHFCFKDIVRFHK